MKLFYLLFILLYSNMAKCLAPFNRKAALWLNGRKDWKIKMKQVFEHETRPVIWMHCASLGEFEQGVPLLENLKLNYPKHFLLVSFFSPSGYEVRKSHPLANFVCYLPMDSASNAKHFIGLAKPTIAIFIKYDFWYYYLKTLNQHHIPTLLVSAIFRKDQLFFKWYGHFYKNMLHYFNYIFLQDTGSKKLLTALNLTQPILTTGDTRFDRVISIASKHNHNDIIAHFCTNKKTIVAGSTWSEDDKCLHHYAISNKSIQFIIAPHDIDQERLIECVQFYPNAILYSEYQKAIFHDQPVKEYQTLVIDNMGMLSSLYRYASIAFIGGGFTDEGVHNTLEAAVYGVPVVFGPVYDKYLEAVELVDIEGAFGVNDLFELENRLNKLVHDDQLCNKIGNNAKNYVHAKSGATAKILSTIQENRLLTN